MFCFTRWAAAATVTKVPLTTSHTVDTQTWTPNHEWWDHCSNENWKKTLKDDTRQHGPPDSDIFTALDTAMRWFWMSAKGKEKKDAIQLLTLLELYDFATQEIIGLTNVWKWKFWKWKFLGLFTVYITKIHYLNMCSSKTEIYASVPYCLLIFLHE